MANTWYGSFQNRLMENKQVVDEIVVGTGITECFYSDRHPYEVVAVQDQKHITIRALDHKMAGEAYSNDWELISNEENPTIDIVKRGNNWYTVVEATPEDAKRYLEAYEQRNNIELQLWFAHNEFDAQKILSTGKPQKRYRKKNLLVGFADYYYDYEF